MGAGGKSPGHRADRESQHHLGPGSRAAPQRETGGPTPALPAARTTPSRDPWLSPARVEGLLCAGPLPRPLVARFQPPSGWRFRRPLPLRPLTWRVSSPSRAHGTAHRRLRSSMGPGAQRPQPQRGPSQMPIQARDRARKRHGSHVTEGSADLFKGRGHLQSLKRPPPLTQIEALVTSEWER